MLALIPLLPLAGFVVNAFLGKRLPKAVSGGIACLVMLAAFVVSLAAAWPLLGHGGHPFEQVVYTWLSSGDLQVPFTLRLDQLSALMILVVTALSKFGYTFFSDDPGVVTDVSSVTNIGRQLFTTHAFAFEVTSILILVSMVGAVVIAGRKHQ